MRTFALLGLSLSLRCTMIKYLSTEIVTRIKMASMLKNMNRNAVISHTTLPNIHSPAMSVMKENGMHVSATMMSAKARLARSRLIADRMAGFWYTIRQTIQLPRILINIINSSSTANGIIAPKPREFGTSPDIFESPLPFVKLQNP